MSKRECDVEIQLLQEECRKGIIMISSLMTKEKERQGKQTGLQPPDCFSSLVIDHACCSDETNACPPDQKLHSSRSVLGPTQASCRPFAVVLELIVGSVGCLGRLHHHHPKTRVDAES